MSDTSERMNDTAMTASEPSVLPTPLPALRGDCPSPWGEPLARAHLKATPDDFHVVEVMGFEPSGEGEHLWLWVEKCGLNTDAVAADIAQRLGLSRNVVSYS
ncbi:MAG: tRNA pseudouridine(13) synthase TruD, partial [Paraperlucidibaca sp.]